MSAPHGDLTFAKLNPQAFHFSQKTSFVVIGLIATSDFRLARHSGALRTNAEAWASAPYGDDHGNITNREVVYEQEC
jgi:hypothetical protein